jgi:hypothetical protein
MNQKTTLPDVVVMVQMSPENWDSFRRAFVELIDPNQTSFVSDTERELLINTMAEMVNALMKNEGSTAKWMADATFGIQSRAVRGAIATAVSPSQN